MPQRDRGGRPQHRRTPRTPLPHHRRHPDPSPAASKGNFFSPPRGALSQRKQISPPQAGGDVATRQRGPPPAPLLPHEHPFLTTDAIPIQAQQPAKEISSPHQEELCRSASKFLPRKRGEMSQRDRGGRPQHRCYPTDTPSSPQTPSRSKPDSQQRKFLLPTKRSSVAAQANFSPRLRGEMSQRDRGGGAPPAPLLPHGHPILTADAVPIQARQPAKEISSPHQEELCRSASKFLPPLAGGDVAARQRGGARSTANTPRCQRLHRRRSPARVHPSLRFTSRTSTNPSSATAQLSATD